MAQLTITIPDDQVTRVFDAVAATYSYVPATDGTKAQFGRKVVMNFIKEIVKAYEATAAAEVARVAALNAAEAEITLS